MGCLKFALAAFVVTVIIAETVAQFTCRGFPDGLYADPKNCTKFYQCDSEKLKYSLTCAHKSPEDFFARDDEKCVLPANHLSECTMKGKRLPYGGEGSYVCPGPDYKLFEHPADCVFYWECNKGGASVRSCNGGMFFQVDTTNPFGGKCVAYTEVKESCSVRGKRYTEDEKEALKNSTPEPSAAPTSGATNAPSGDQATGGDAGGKSSGTGSNSDSKNGSSRLFLDVASVTVLIASVMLWY
ncbi:uncharacterized protein LOC106159622 [Lingula anatina]|uniref:Uncharacterized protein LOC106159622 n=1 Tax=Lingula anatina TaxID=7574 RepID=A0A1S3I0P3_LINAN|nr:uncharacterized protein LOC106159622 [Lingula anatina]XP_013391395.1 uncharacterized protein LOC106159622 [Lingula anatina]XP_013391396.1 uncharacterized protein LOC106159622 [Lingula anatina]|eukprot:XP_013391394.1 uncharacterized protein LOC106159622 [Lingula anatina]